MATAVALLVTVRVEARELEVDSEADAPDVSPGDGVCAAEDGSCTLRAAVQESNSGPGPNTIVLPVGVYELTRLGEENAAGSGDLDIAVDLEIHGAGTEKSIIDGVGASAIFEVEPGVRLLVRDLAIRNGGLEDDRVITNLGWLRLERCRLSDSGRDGRGSVLHSSGGLSVVDSVLEDNRGLLIDDDGVVLDRSVLRRNQDVLESDEGGASIARSEIAENGGRIYGCPVVTDSVIRANGYGIACPGGGVVVLRSRIESNGGAGINSDGSVYVLDSTIRDNGPLPDLGIPAGLGVVGNGGIVALGPAVVERSTIAGNRGYGLDVETTAELSNVTVSGNRAVGGFGGGLLLGRDDSRIESSTIVDNVGVGIDIRNQGHPARGVVLQRSIVAGNSSVDDRPANCGAGRLVLDGHNIIGDDAGCELTTTDTDRVDTDPLLGPLADNGGPTQTHAPVDGSPALDGGGEDACPATDQRGARRPQGERCDIGAVEGLTSCGDGRLDPGEDCDDGHAADGDCCTSVCRFVAPLGGDCDGNGAVEVNELVLAIALALDNRRALDCEAIDQDGDLRVTIAELVAAVGHLVDGTSLSCP